MEWESENRSNTRREDFERCFVLYWLIIVGNSCELLFYVLHTRHMYIMDRKEHPPESERNLGVDFCVGGGFLLGVVCREKHARITTIVYILFVIVMVVVK